MDKRFGVAAAVTGIVLAAPGIAAAQDLPPGTASGVAAQVEGIVAVSQTGAEANEGGGSSSANVVQLGDTTVIGGTSEGGGKLFGTGPTPLGEANVAPWSATTGAGNGCNTATASSAVANAAALGAVTLDVLQSSSSANHCGNKSGGAASSDGAVIDIGNGALHLVVLHSDASTSNQKPNSWILGINDTRLLTDEDLGPRCVLQIPSLVGLVCLSVSGGANAPVGASLADVGVADGSVSASAFGAAAAPAEAARTAGAPEVLSGTTAPAPESAAAASTGSLARTGMELGALAFIGANLAAAGAALRRRARR